MNISEVTLSNVRSAYSGKAGRCCCGCSGKHVYQERTRELASKRRGYSVNDDEINEKKIASILKKIQNDPQSYAKDSYIALEIERKLYIVYLVSENEGA